MCTHWSPEWLARHRNLPDKAGHVECYSVNDYLEFRKNQPSALLHELAHCYHYRMHKHIDKGIVAAYESALSSGKYNDVSHISGRTGVPHYARTNHYEYFAECTEAFFSSSRLRNDYFPFVHHELLDFDRRGYEMVVEAWRVPRRHLRRHWCRSRRPSESDDTAESFVPSFAKTSLRCCCYSGAALRATA